MMKNSAKNILRFAFILGMSFLCELTSWASGSYKAYLEVKRYLITSSGSTQSTTTAGSVNLYYVDHISKDPISGVNSITASCTSIGYRKIDIDITAVPATGYHFHHWGTVTCTEGDGAIDYDRSSAFNQYQNPEYVRVQNAGANIKTKKYTIDVFFQENFYANVSANVTTGASGSATASGTNNTETSGGSLTFNLTAPAAAPGYHFTGWSGTNISFASSGSLITTATVSASTTSGSGNARSYTATANYAPNYYANVVVQTTAGASGSASVSGTNNTATAGGSLLFNLTAPSASSGYHFTGWTGLSISFGSAGSLQTTATVSAATTGGSSNARQYTATANYVENIYYAKLTATAGANGSVSVTETPKSTKTPGGNVTFNIKATPATGYHLVNWTVTSGSGSFGSSTSANTTFTAAASSSYDLANATSYTVNATFAKDQFKVSLTSGINSLSDASSSTAQVSTDNTNWSSSANYTAGTAGANVTMYVKATPATGYKFIGWSETNGSSTTVSGLGATGTYVIKAPTTEGATTSKALYAIFKKMYVIVINANGSGSDMDRIVFNVTGPANYRVSVPVGGSATLKDVAAGTYTITPEGDWNKYFNISPSSATTSFNSVNKSTSNFTITSKTVSKKHAEAKSVITY